MRVAGHEHPVVFAFIAWMKRYRGALLSDIPTWAGSPAPGGRVGDEDDSYPLGEVLAFDPCKRGRGGAFYAGDVQHNFATKRLGGDGKSAAATVIWCAADPEDGERIKAIGFYRGATVFAKHQSRRPLSPRGPRSGTGQPPDYNVKCPAKQGVLIPVRKRPALPSVPGSSRNGRWQSNAKVWTGETKPPPEQRVLERFVRRLLAGEVDGDEEPVLPPEYGVYEDEIKGMPPEKRERLHELFVRDRKHVRQLKALYGGVCQVTGKRALGGVAGDLCEVHHLVWLARGGDDHPQNMMVVSPDVHAAIHATDGVLVWDRGRPVLVVGARRMPLAVNKHLRPPA